MKVFVLPILFTATLTAADAHLADSMNTFAADIYKQVVQADENLILSPFNIATAVSMVLAGSRGRTAQEVQSVLHLPNDANTHAALGAMLAELAQAGNTGENELLTANGLWVQKGFPVQPAFESTVTGSYHAAFTPVDFIGGSEAARSRINQWTEEHTKGKIKNLFPAGSLNAESRLVLSSAIYFYGKWQAPFLSTRTRPAPFFLPNGAATEAEFMNQTSRFGYTEAPSAQILEMRYAETGIAFDVLLPKAVAGLRELEKSLTQETLTGWTGKLSSRRVQVSLPKFRVESQFSLARALSLMGMPTAFSRNADFSGISSQGPLFISEAVHKAFVDVSEQGTEAAAATGLSMTLAAVIPGDKVVVFRADHPFLFLIRDTRSEAILFMGRVSNPKI
jgi:serine protease inhibitor